MENEILQQILDTQKQILGKVDTLEQDVSGIKQDVSDLKQGQTELQQGQAETNKRLERVEQKVTKIEVTLENETNHNINLLVDGHKGLVKKLDGLPEKIVALQDSDLVQNVAIKELSRRTASK